MADVGSSRSGWRIAAGWIAAMALGAGFAWVAFGPGPRHCSVSLSVPFLAAGERSGEAMCRGAFGAATLLASPVWIARWVMRRFYARRGDSTDSRS